ncbi:MAG: 16S rRNA (guanine(527)-N(7))-methyltransferase RsmG [Lysobacterales bacterium]
MESLRPALERGLDALAIAANPAFTDGLLAYVALLARWNAVYNLTAVRDPREMLTRHLLDSLVVAPYVGGGTMADLGSGAGLPGIPLALLDRTRCITLVESNGKKARFLRTAVRELALAHVDVFAGRAESARVDPKASVIARALAPLDELVRLAEPWLASDGQLLAMKGPGAESELAMLPKHFEIVAQHRLRVPGLDGERYLVVLKRAPDPSEPERSFP